jgi:hypothetical protein
MPDEASSTPLPLLLAGPILRRCTSERLTLWIATSAPVRTRLRVCCDEAAVGAREFVLEPGADGCRSLRSGAHLYFQLLDVRLPESLPRDRWIGYELALQPTDDAAHAAAPWLDCTDATSGLRHDGQCSPGFVLPSRVAAVLHGSCRKPHFPGRDGLAQADRLVGRLLGSGARSTVDDAGALPAWPSTLILSGDQVYLDDVAGPMLRAMHGLVERLGLPTEPLPGLRERGVVDSADLYVHPDGYYRRERLLPRRRRNRALIDVLFRGVEKPIFTGANAHNHLITLGEVLAMYLLAWSPVPWTLVNLEPPAGLDAECLERYRRERAALTTFVQELPAVRRAFAHLPVAMIFDDHDITDDWNLSREWEEVAYGHAFSRRVIGNALLGYAIAQAWGNRPEIFDDAWLQRLQQALDRPGSDEHERTIDALLQFRRWHYEWPSQPPLMAVDSRSRRWHSSGDPRRPSGLLDPQGLAELQQALRGQSAVLLVTPGPIFGVKLIEAIQRVFSWLGLSLMVDAENWMAHRGCAHAVLDMFRDPATPRNFVILSGDVHYSFVYDVELRGASGGPDVWQITSSGLRNAFPDRLLAALDHLNRWLYSPRSPLNVFTRRRRMRVVPRKPVGTPHGRRLLNGSGIGLVEIDEHGRPWRIREIRADGETVEFERREAESRWE